MFYTCPFCWKVRGIVDHLGLDVDYISVNPMRSKKALEFTDGWTKVPVWTESDGEIVVDSTPILKHIDAKYNQGELCSTTDQERQDKWLEWVDGTLSKATIPLLYGGLGSALKTTFRVSKLEKFGFISKRVYAWMGFPVMWGIIARSRVKKDGRKPKQLWHDLLSEWVGSHEGKPFFGGEKPDIVDIAAFGYMRSVADYPQFSKISDHEAGMAWYNRMLATMN